MRIRKDVWIEVLGPDGEEVAEGLAMELADDLIAKSPARDDYTGGVRVLVRFSPYSAPPPVSISNCTVDGVNKLDGEKKAAVDRFNALAGEPPASARLKELAEEHSQYSRKEFADSHDLAWNAGREAKVISSEFSHLTSTILSVGSEILKKLEDR